MRRPDYLKVRILCVIVSVLLSAFLPSQAIAATTMYADNPVPQVVHPAIGKSMTADGIKVTFINRKSYYTGAPKSSLDPNVRSPKSVNIHPTKNKFYVNSLEGGKTVVYDLLTGERLKVIAHKFDNTHKDLWAPESGLFKFNYTPKAKNTFTGKPVESVLSHNGRYLWVPYYRRSYDINAQDPSAMAVIDTENDTIIRLFETGPLPKMVAVSPDQKMLAVTHWGNNTVGLIDISSANPSDWKYVTCVVVDKALKLNFSRTVKVDRDSNSGYCLRGTVFTPDGKYLLVGCMGGGGGIAVIDLQNNRYRGRIMGAMPSLRHLIIKNGYLFASINASGYVQRISMETILSSIQSLDGHSRKQVTVKGWVSCKVPAGARTIEITPNGKYIFVACNYGSALAVVDAEKMKLVGKLSADSFPVGLDISRDGRYAITTSQGRKGCGGNSVNIFEIKYL